ncbi:MAG: hypothetical protein J7J51_02445 [Candidatus Omnitrophica bacterium]|nr:hypothetical protein [Candidatus Omnitrophota bacterium]
MRNLLNLHLISVINYKTSHSSRQVIKKPSTNFLLCPKPDGLGYGSHL